MIKDNMSSVFRDNVPGYSPSMSEEGRIIHNNSQDMYENLDFGSDRIMSGPLKGSKPIDFESQIMGGEKAKAYFGEKLPSISGVNNYSDRLSGILRMPEGNSFDDQKFNSLIGGGAKMPLFVQPKKTKIVKPNLKGVKKPNFDVSNYLGTSSKGGKKLPLDQIRNAFSFSKGTKKDMPITKVNDMLSFNKGFSKSKNVVNDVLGTSFGAISSSKNNFKDVMSKISNTIGVSSGRAKIYANPMGIDSRKKDMDINSLFGIMGNPEKTAKNRLAMQKGLPMFGDWDGDGVANILDCNPLNKMLQEEANDKNIADNYANIEDIPQVVSPAEEVITEDPDRGMSESVEDSREGYSQEDMEAQTVSDSMAIPNGADNYYDFTGTGISSSDEEEYEEPMAQGQVLTDEDFYQPQVEGVQVTMPQKEGFMDKIKQYAGNVIAAKQQRQQGVSVDDDMASERMSRINSQISEQERLLFRNNLEMGKASTERKKELRAENANIKFMIDKLQASKRGEFSLQKLQKLDIPKFEFEKKLAMQRMKEARSKGDLALWEKKLKAGENLLGSLIGPSGEKMYKSAGRLTGMDDVASRSMQSQFVLSSGVGAQGSGAREALGSYGGQGMFGTKVAESVGGASGLLQAPKSFSQKVSESVGGGSVYDTIRQQNLQMIGGMPTTPQGMQQPQMSMPINNMAAQRIPLEPQRVVSSPNQQASQMPNAPQVQGEYQPSQFERMQRIYAQQPTQLSSQQGSNGMGARPLVDWDKMTPEQAAQYDRDYAKYLKESDAEYRRGPYKKNK